MQAIIQYILHLILPFISHSIPSSQFYISQFCVPFCIPFYLKFYSTSLAFIPNSISTFHATFLYSIFGALCVLPLHSTFHSIFHATCSTLYSTFLLQYLPFYILYYFYDTCTCTFLSPLCATKPFQIPCYFLLQIPYCTCCTFHSLFRSTFHILDTVV